MTLYVLFKVKPPTQGIVMKHNLSMDTGWISGNQRVIEGGLLCLCTEIIHSTITGQTLLCLASVLGTVMIGISFSLSISSSSLFTPSPSPPSAGLPSQRVVLHLSKKFHVALSLSTHRKKTICTAKPSSTEEPCLLHADRSYAFLWGRNNM